MAGGVLTTRFAPSPTGPLHLGHAYAAIFAHDLARRNGGRFLLRIEDIDRQRSRPEWEQRLCADLAWLGLTWDEAPMRQSERQAAYDSVLDHLWAMGLLYPCTCTRRDIDLALAAPQEGVPAQGPDGPVYPGTCRNAPRTGARPRDAHMRLDIAAAWDRIGKQYISFEERGASHYGHWTFDQDHYRGSVGDVIIARRDFGTSYHLAVVVDDAAQDVSDVTRGEDLFAATSIHVLLQKLLEYRTPTYWHHELIRDDTGKRLAKRDDARALARYRDDGLTPDGVRRMLGL